MFESLLFNFPLITSVSAIIFAQLFKVLWNYIITKKMDWTWVTSSGGMPSGHTAAVTSLATSIGLTTGWESVSFAISTILAIIVMYDATGIRRQAGMQAQVLNRLLEEFSKLMNELRHRNLRMTEETKVKLKEIIGHQPVEVLTGGILGVSLAVILYWIWY